MRIVLDTNVLVSGIFFGGVPGQILEAWRDRQIQLVLSPQILEEYYRVGRELAEKYVGVDLNPFLELLAVHADVVEAPELTEKVCADPDDDKFLACALASGAEAIVSGDRHLLDRSGWRGIRVVTPRQFFDKTPSCPKTRSGPFCGGFGPGGRRPGVQCGPRRPAVDCRDEDHPVPSSGSDARRLAQQRAAEGHRIPEGGEQGPLRAARG